MMQLLLNLSRRMDSTRGRLGKGRGSSVLDQVGESGLKHVKCSFSNPIFSFQNMQFMGDRAVPWAQFSLVRRTR